MCRNPPIWISAFTRFYNNTLVAAMQVFRKQKLMTTSSGTTSAVLQEAVLFRTLIVGAVLMIVEASGAWVEGNDMGPGDNGPVPFLPM